MQKVKHDFQVANREISLGNVCMIQSCFIFFDCNSCLTLKLSTACNKNLNSTIIKLGRNEINTHTEHLGRFPSVRTDWPDHSRRNDNFTFNNNYPTRSVKS